MRYNDLRASPPLDISDELLLMPSLSMCQAYVSYAPDHSLRTENSLSNVHITIPTADTGGIPGHWTLTLLASCTEAWG